MKPKLALTLIDEFGMTKHVSMFDIDDFDFPMKIAEPVAFNDDEAGRQAEFTTRLMKRRGDLLKEMGRTMGAHMADQMNEADGLGADIYNRLMHQVMTWRMIGVQK